MQLASKILTCHSLLVGCIPKETWEEGEYLSSLEVQTQLVGLLIQVADVEPLGSGVDQPKAYLLSKDAVASSCTGGSVVPLLLGHLAMAG